tara:strand:+ start:456 stop:662 length:207 start_codon:yes stop_codon:yes gene_type:complete
MDMSPGRDEEKLMKHPSVLKSELRTKYRKAHGTDWWQDPDVKTKYKAELKVGQKKIREALKKSPLVSL